MTLADPASRPKTLIPGIELKGPIPPAFTDPNEIVDFARLLVEKDWSESGFLAQLPEHDLLNAVLAVVSRAHREGWRPRLYLWPDFTAGWLSHDPTDEQLIDAYSEWRQCLELEVSIPHGTA
jgi:hypothetical protein